ncbi:MAG: nuclear transport factor 2 family protein [Alphaproteobacteria bacterium]
MAELAFAIQGGGDQPVADQMAIHSLLNQYCHVVDRGTVDEIAALFCEDAILRPLHEGPEVFEGRAAIRAWYDSYDKRVRVGRRHRLHRISVPFIVVDGATARVDCYLDSTAVLVATNVISVSAGRYEDKLVKADGRWLFRDRTIIINHVHRIETFEEPAQGN